MEDSSEGDGNTCKYTNAYTKIITENIIINEYVEQSANLISGVLRCLFVVLRVPCLYTLKIYKTAYQHALTRTKRVKSKNQ